MTQGVSDRPWQADVRTSETKQFIRDIKRITRRKCYWEQMELVNSHILDFLSGDK